MLRREGEKERVMTGERKMTKGVIGEVEGRRSKGSKK